MGKRKRKNFEDRSRFDSHGLSMGGAARQFKRARSSSAGSMSAETSHQHSSRLDDDGWQTVTSKKQRQGQHNRPEIHITGDGRPKVYFEGDKARRKDVRLEDLRDLALYVLADAPGPGWVAVRKAKEIKKVVIVMVPGLDKGLMGRARALLSDQKLQASNRNGQTVSSEDNVNEEHHNTQNGPDGKSETQSEDIDRFIDELFVVKSPGDGWQMKVHSPLQAVLLKPFDKPYDKKHKQDDHFYAVRTPIVDFVHSVNDLRDAEYPLHPALLALAAEAETEKARRQSAGQTSEDGWVDTEVHSDLPTIPRPSNSSSHDFVAQGLSIYAIDCEMVLTTDKKSSLARISVVAWPDGKVVMDKFVKPTIPVENYFTQYSGITEDILKNVTTTLDDVQKELMKLFTPSTILLGQSLESDLCAMKMTHPFIIDTSLVYPHPRGLPLRSSLKYLTSKYLKRDIQNGGSNGHDSVEDARAVLDLVKLKCEKGPKWGTNEANGEAVFKKLSRTLRSDGRPRTSAMVEYGTPERGFGKDATHTIGCQNDEEIVRGIMRSAQGDSADETLPPGGVDFVWGRLRSLEHARGWVNYNASAHIKTNTNPSTKDPPSSPTQPNQTSTTTNKPFQNPPPPAPFTPTPESDKLLLETISNMIKIRTSLPEDSLLIFCNGTDDMRTVMHYQTLQQQYRKEFRVKKWNEITVRWTDDEEQALRKAVEKARIGWGWVGVV